MLQARLKASVAASAAQRIGRERRPAARRGNVHTVRTASDVAACGTAGALVTATLMASNTRAAACEPAKPSLAERACDVAADESAACAVAASDACDAAAALVNAAVMASNARAAACEPAKPSLAERGCDVAADEPAACAVAASDACDAAAALVSPAG
jgi:hypothetical protein